MNENQQTEININSLASVMKAIFARGDVPHKELVKLRRRAIELHTAQKTTVEIEQRVSQAMIAFTFLVYLEKDEPLTPKQIRNLGMDKVLEDARRVAAAWQGEDFG